MGVECCWKAYWCGGKAGSAAASIIIVLHPNTIYLHGWLILALFCCIVGPAHFLPLEKKKQASLLDLDCSKMNFPLFSFCGWLQSGKLCELTNCTTFLNVCACLAESILYFHILSQSGGFQWGYRSGALVTDTSNHFRIAHLSSSPSAVVHTYTHS